MPSSALRAWRARPESRHPWSRAPTSRGPSILPPPRDGDARSFARLGPDVELINESLRSPQPEPHAGAGAVPISECQRQVSNSRSAILEGEPQARAPRILERFDTECTATTVGDGVASQLAGRGHDLRLIDEPQPQVDGPLSNDLPDVHDVILGSDRHDLMAQDGHRRPRPPRCAPPRARAPSPVPH